MQNDDMIIIKQCSVSECQLSAQSEDESGKGFFYGAMATEDMDLTGDIIASTAFDTTLKSYKKRKRPIQLYYNHIMSELPIGIIPIDSIKKEGKKWTVKGELNLNTQRGREIYSLMQQKALFDLSIHGKANDIDYESVKGSRVLNNIDMYEVSVVSHPGNQDANVDVVKGTTSFSDLPLADRERPWSKSEALGRVRKLTGSDDKPSSSYKNAFMWYDAENADNFGAYKLPYADVINGRLTAIPRAIFAVGTRISGTDIPDADREKVISHVNRYRKKMNMPNLGKGFFEYEDCLEIKSKRDFETVLKDSGLFSNKASVYLASFFNEISQKDASSLDQITEKLDSYIEQIKILKEGFQA